MPDLPLRQKGDKLDATTAPRRCAHCHEELQLVRRHISPARLGAPITTEFYECRACDSGFTLDPKTGRWKPSVGDQH